MSITGAEAAASPGDVAATSDVVLVAVVDADQVRDALTRADGILGAARPGLIVAVLSTVAVSAVIELAALASASGVRLIDVGVTGPPKAPEQGQLVAMVGGDDDVVADARPALESFTKLVTHMGPLGAGMATKIALNVVTYSSWLGVHEATMLAERAGVDLSRFAEAIEAGDPQGRIRLILLRRRAAGITAGDEGMRRMGVIMDKDLAAAVELAAENGIEVRAVEQSRASIASILGLEEAARG